MKKLAIFVLGIICGFLINNFTESKTAIPVESPKSIITIPVESSNVKVVKQEPQKQEIQQEKNMSYVRYVRYWQSGGFKFKDVGDNGVEKTYVWNASSNQWVDSGCTGYFNKE